MKHFGAAELDSQRAGAGKSYLEFLRSHALSVGLYVLRAGEQDTQQPHTEDEVYYVIEGRASFQAGSENLAIQAGSVLYVEAGEEHRFHSIEQDLKVLVLFAPPEGLGTRHIS